MRSFLIAVLLALCALTLAETYKVEHRRPSTLLANVMGTFVPGARAQEVVGGTGLVPVGVTLKANDKESTIEITGKASMIEDAKRLLAEFDVAPRKVTAHIIVRSKLDKYETKTDAEIDNNGRLALHDETTGLTLTLSPRINADATVTGRMILATEIDRVETNLVTRTKSMEAVDLTPVGEGADRHWTTLHKTGKVEEPDLVVELRFEVKDK